MTVDRLCSFDTEEQAVQWFVFEQSNSKFFFFQVEKRQKIPFVFHPSDLLFVCFFDFILEALDTCQQAKLITVVFVSRCGTHTHMYFVFHCFDYSY